MMLVDTSAVLASINRGDDDHAACRRLLLDANHPLLLPVPVVVEVDYWIRKTLGRPAEDAFFDDLVSGAYEAVNLEPRDLTRIREICRTYSDPDIGLLDASILAIAERLNVTRLATLDHRHFRLMRPRHVDALTLQPE